LKFENGYSLTEQNTHEFIEMKEKLFGISVLQKKRILLEAYRS